MRRLRLHLPARPMIALALLIAAAFAVQPQPLANPVSEANADEGDGAGTLTLLHSNDGESSLSPLTYAVDAGGSSVALPIGGIAAYKTVTDDQIDEATTLGNAIVNVYAGDAFLASAALTCSQQDGNPVCDALGQAAIPYTAHIFGNHEFDYSPDFLLDFINAFGGTQPFLSANLDFSGEAAYAGLVDADGLIDGAPAGGRIIGRSMLYVDPATGQRFGIVGATTPSLPTISSPRNVEVTPDLTATAAAAQEEIDRLLGMGVQKIIFVSHLQSVENDRELIPMLSGIDIAVAGGGDELLTSPALADEAQLLPGEQAPIAGEYPFEVIDADGRTVYVVTTAGNYKYLGRLDVEFDDDGEVSEIIAEMSYPRRIIPASAEATGLGLADVVTPDAGVQSSVVDPIEDCVAELGETAVATTEVLLDVSRDTVRGKESNAGNHIADAFVAAYDSYADSLGLPARGAANRVVALQNGGGIRQNAGDILPRDGTVPGTLTLLDTIDVLPFGNFVTIVSGVTPADLKTIFERSAETLPSAGGQFMQVSGIEVVYDLNFPVG
ncbi:MAG: bifunctional metallophosphatase/5'-nucleotidase, partial [Tepidiformaceae bacterium]